MRFLQSEGVEIVATKATLGPGDATTYAREAVAQGCDAFFLSGGDGTIAQAIGGLIHTDTALAILPGGTGNVFARQLNLPVPGRCTPNRCSKRPGCYCAAGCGPSTSAASRWAAGCGVTSSPGPAWGSTRRSAARSKRTPCGRSSWDRSHSR